MAITMPVKLTFENDKSSLSKAKKEAQKEAGQGGNQRGGTGRAAAVGGAVGGFLGSLTGQLDSITGFLRIIAGALNAIVAPLVPLLIVLFRPFLILFIGIGGLLAKWLAKALQTEGGQTGGAVGAAGGFLTGLRFGGIVTAIIGAVIGAFTGLSFGAALEAALTGAIRGLDFSSFITAIDEAFGTNVTDQIIGAGQILAGFILLIKDAITFNWEAIPNDLALIGLGFQNIITGLKDTFEVLFIKFINGLKTIINGAIGIINDAAEFLGFDGIDELEYTRLPARVSSSRATPEQLSSTRPQQNVTVNISGNADKKTIDQLIRELNGRRLIN